MGKKVFISYRRDGGAVTARLIFRELEVRKIAAFLDVESLGRSTFDDRLLREIEESPNFLLILSPNSLDRCKEKDDWLTKEIAHAIVKDKNIVPLLEGNFSFPPPESLPEEIRKLPRYNYVEFSHSYFGASMDKLCSFLEITEESPIPFEPVAKEKVTEPQIRANDANEQKYLNALRIAYADGEISPAEKDKINCLLMDFGILPARAKELEEQVKKESGMAAKSEQSIEEKSAGAEPVKEQTLEWPEVGQQFLKELKKAVDLSKLPFQPVEVSTEENIDENVELDWWINDDYYFSSWFFSKKLEKVNLAWGIYSRKQRDPLFREFCDELCEIQDLLNNDGDISINDYIYHLNTEGCLGFDTSERIAFSELSSPDYVKCVTDQIIAVSQKLWPVIQKKLS